MIIVKRVRRWRPTDVNPGSSARAGVTAPVSHQKRPNRSATNEIEFKQKDSKINEADRYPAAHNGLVAGSKSPGKIARSWMLLLLLASTTWVYEAIEKGANRFARYVF
jgi:hypothetical protein